MRKAAVVFLGIVFGLTVLFSAVEAAEKFAYVNLSKIFSEYKKTQDFDKVLGDKEQVFTTERDKRVNEIKQTQDKINLLSDKEKEAKKADMEAKIKDLQEFDRQKQADLRKEQDEKMKELLKDIEEAVKQYSEKDGLTLVFNDRVLIYQAKNLDITGKITEILSKKYKK